MAAGELREKGGYDYDFVDDPPKSLECSICLLTLRDPHVISCCGNEFCQACIERVQRDGRPCPLCNERRFTTFLHKKLLREVNELSVFCPRKDLGCEWVGELGQLEKHINAVGSSSGGCGYVMVDCNYQCGALIQRRMVETHEKENCPKRPVEMQIASLMQKYMDVTVRVDTLIAECNVLRQEVKTVTEENQLLKQELQQFKEEVQAQLGKKLDPGITSEQSEKQPDKPPAVTIKFPTYQFQQTSPVKKNEFEPVSGYAVPLGKTVSVTSTGAEKVQVLSRSHFTNNIQLKECKQKPVFNIGRSTTLSVPRSPPQLPSVQKREPVKLNTGTPLVMPPLPSIPKGELTGIPPSMPSSLPLPSIPTREPVKLNTITGTPLAVPFIAPQLSVQKREPVDTGVDRVVKSPFPFQLKEFKPDIGHSVSMPLSFAPQPSEMKAESATSEWKKKCVVIGRHGGVNPPTFKFPPRKEGVPNVGAVRSPFKFNYQLPSLEKSENGKSEVPAAVDLFKDFPPPLRRPGDEATDHVVDKVPKLSMPSTSFVFPERKPKFVIL